MGLYTTTEQAAAPSTPASGSSVLYPKTDGLWYWKDDAGVEHAVVGNDTTQELTGKTLNACVGKGTWTASGTWTLPALTLGGNVASTGNPSLNIGTGVFTAGSCSIGVNTSNTGTNTTQSLYGYRASSTAWNFQNNATTNGYVLQLTSGTVSGTGFNLSDGYSDIFGSPQLEFFIRGDGTFGSRTNVYGATSDIKLKTDIELSGSQLNDVVSLASLVKKYRLKSDPQGAKMLGWIAQDVEAVCPGLVDEQLDREFFTNEDGERESRPSGTTTKSIKYSIAYMKAFKALGEAIELLRAQQVEIDGLKAAVSELQK